MILDTTFIIDLMRNDEIAVSKLHELIKRGETQLLTSLTIFELFSGLTRCSKPSDEKNKILQTLNDLLILPFDGVSAEKAGEIDGNLIKTGEMIGPIDSMMAGIAITKKEKILTRNTKDFSKIKGIEIESY